MSAVVEAGAFLEAAVNELFKDCFDDHHSYVETLNASSLEALKLQWTTWHDGKRRTIPTLEKFDSALVSCGLDPLNRGAAPTQDAIDVLDLRNALMHSTPEWVSAQEDHRFDKLRSRFQGNVLMAKSGNAYFPDICLGSGCASWAAASVRRFADHFFESIGVQPNYQRVQFRP